MVSRASTRAATLFVIQTERLLFGENPSNFSILLIANLIETRKSSFGTARSERKVSWSWIFFYDSSSARRHCWSTRHWLPSTTRRSIHSRPIMTTSTISVDPSMGERCRRTALTLTTRARLNRVALTYHPWRTTTGCERQLMASNLRWMQSIKFRNEFSLHLTPNWTLLWCEEQFN